MHYFAFIVASLLILVHVVAMISFIVFSFKEKYKKAEKIMMADGYYLIASMILLFIFLSIGYDKSTVTVELDYTSLWFALAAIPFCILLFFADFKLQRYIRRLSIDGRKEQGFSLESRRFIIFVIMAMTFVNFALYCVNAESFFYIVLF